jgi:hypothetical protein
MSVARYLLGIGTLAVVVASLSFAATALRRRYFPAWNGALARLAEAVIALAVLSLILQLLGAIGWFRLGPIVVACALCGFAAWRWAWGPAAVVTRRTRWTATALIALIVAGVLVAEWSGPTLSAYEFGIRGFDSLWYHLPWAASFAQTGHITPLRFTDVEYLTAFYPATAELIHGFGIVALGRDTLSPGLNLLWLIGTLLAAYCVGRPRGLGHATLLGAAVVMATPAMTLSQGGSAANDIVGIFFLIAAMAFVFNGPSYVLGGIAAGLACSTKLSMLAAVAALTVAVLAAAPRGTRRTAAIRWLVPLALLGVFWYLRNLIAVGNPVPWINVPGLATPAVPLQAHTGFTIVHYATNTHVWSAYFAPGLHSGLGTLWPVILIAALIGPLLGLFPGASRATRLLSLAALVALLAYLVTPEGAAGPPGMPLGFAFNLRYLAPGLALCLTVLPLAPAFESPRARIAVAIALAILLLVTLLGPHLWPTRQLLGAIAIGLGALLVGALSRVHLSRAVGAALVVGLLLAATAAGYPWQRRYLHGRYAYQPGVSYLSRVWALFRDVHHARVALVGTYGGFFSYPLFGLDNSNRVQYVAARGADGSFTPIVSCRQWLGALRDGHFQYVVSTPARDPWERRRLTTSPEFAWTAADPGAQIIYRRPAAGQTIAVFRLRTTPDPSSC